MGVLLLGFRGPKVTPIRPAGQRSALLHFLLLFNANLAAGAGRGRLYRFVLAQVPKELADPRLVGRLQPLGRCRATDTAGIAAIAVALAGSS